MRYSVRLINTCVGTRRHSRPQEIPFLYFRVQRSCECESKIIGVKGCQKMEDPLCVEWFPWVSGKTGRTYRL